MITLNGIEIHQNSIDYVKEIFSKYTETTELKSTYKSPIIHMYAKEDTYDEQGNLNGYIDGLFFELHLYDTENSTVWKSNRYYDGICPFDDLRVSQIKIFKDMSTMIALSGLHEVNGSYQAFEVRKV